MLLQVLHHLLSGSCHRLPEVADTKMKAWLMACFWVQSPQIHKRHRSLDIKRTMTYLCLHQTQYVTCHAHLTPNAAQLHWSMNPILGSKLPGLHKIQRQNPIRRDWKRRICETTNQCLLVGCQPSEFAWICDSFLLPHPFWGPQKFWATPRSALPSSIPGRRKTPGGFVFHPLSCAATSSQHRCGRYTDLVCHLSSTQNGCGNV